MQVLIYLSMGFTDNKCDMKLAYRFELLNNFNSLKLYYAFELATAPKARFLLPYC